MKPHVEISRSSQTCGRCSGNGCGKCGGTGEEAAPPYVTSVTCVCGHEANDWSSPSALASSAGVLLCPQCGADWSEPIFTALLEPDGEPWDRDVDEPIGMDDYGAMGP